MPALATRPVYVGERAPRDPHDPLFFRFVFTWTGAYVAFTLIVFAVARGEYVRNLFDSMEQLIWLLVPWLLTFTALALLALLRKFAYAAEARPGTLRVVQFLPYPFTALAYAPWLFFWWGSLGPWSVVMHLGFAAAVHLAAYRPHHLATGSAVTS